MAKLKISRLQVLTIVANLVFGKAIGFSSATMARTVGNDAWISMLIAFLIGFPVMGAMVWLAARFGEEEPTAYLPRLLGGFLAPVAMLGLAIFFFVSFLTSAITIELHVTDYLLTETPLIIFVVGYSLLCLYGAYLGIEVIARLSVLGLMMSALLNVLMLVGSVDHVRLERLLPLFDHGVIPTVLASAGALPDVTMATAGALMVLPLIVRKKGHLGPAWWGLLIGLVLVIIWPVFEITVLGPEVSSLYLYSCMQLARSAELSVYLPRYELIMVVVFVYGVLIQSMVCLYAACELTAAALPFRVKRPIVYWACSLLTIPVNWWLAHDRDFYSNFLARGLPMLAIAVGMGLPLLICLIALLRPSIRAGRDGGGGERAGAPAD